MEELVVVLFADLYGNDSGLVLRDGGLGSVR